MHNEQEQEEKFIDRKEWSLRRVLSFLIVLPGFCLFSGYWVLCLISLLLLVYLYFKHPIFIEYRSEGKWFSQYVKIMTFSNLCLGILPYFNSELRGVALTIWIPIILIGGCLEPRYLKSDKDFKGFLRRRD